MEVLMLGGLLLGIVSMFIAFSRGSSTDDGPQQAYVIKGLVLAFFAVGAFNVGRGLLGVMPANTLDSGYLTMGGWAFAGPLILLFLFGFSYRRKIRQTASRF
ncbi:MAG: hypothetical protein P4N59_23120 [Negativicutes bacterium]|nr:hypothetical protein [Negativicutes bacterium]